MNKVKDCFIKNIAVDDRARYRITSNTVSLLYQKAKAIDKKPLLVIMLDDTVCIEVAIIKRPLSADKDFPHSILIDKAQADMFPLFVILTGNGCLWHLNMEIQSLTKESSI